VLALVPARRVAAAFLAAVERFADFAFLVAAAFLAATDRFDEVERLAADLFAPLARAALVVPARLVAAPFLAAVERVADFAFLVAAAFLAAVDLDDLVDFLAGAMRSPSFPCGDHAIRASWLSLSHVPHLVSSRPSIADLIGE
jgi:hypothetical protein